MRQQIPITPERDLCVTKEEERLNNLREKIPGSVRKSLQEWCGPYRNFDDWLGEAKFEQALRAYFEWEGIDSAYADRVIGLMKAFE
jgi:hypothetical protein